MTALDPDNLEPGPPQSGDRVSSTCSWQPWQDYTVMGWTPTNRVVGRTLRFDLKAELEGQRGKINGELRKTLRDETSHWGRNTRHLIAPSRWPRCRRR